MTEPASPIAPLLLIRPDSNKADADALAEVGIDSVIEPLVRIAPTEGSGAARRLADRLLEARTGSWLVVTSPRTWWCWQGLVADLTVRLNVAVAAGLRIATVGRATTVSLPESVHSRTLTSPGIAAEQLLATLLEHQPGTAIIPASSRARGVLPDGLSNAGWQVHQAKVYDVLPLLVAPPSLSRLTDGSLGGVLVRSPSAADALAALVPGELPVPVFAVGPITTARCRSHGWQVTEIYSTAPDQVAAAVTAALG